MKSPSKPFARPLVILVLGAIGQSDAFPQAPPRPKESVHVIDDYLKKVPASEIRIGSFEIILDTTTLDEVGLELHRVVPSRTGTGRSGFSWFCFTALNSQRASRVWIESDDQMGGRDAVVTGIYAIELPKTSKPTSDCPSLPNGHTQFVFDNGLWLGASAKDAGRSLGSAPDEDGWSRYSNENSESLGAHGKLGRFDIRIKKGVVVAMRATHTETY
jgi:hypothetical protein